MNSTNKLTTSNDFSSYSTSGTITLTSNYRTSPTGEINSTRVQFGGSNNSLFKLNVHSGNTESNSIYIKGVNGETIKFGRGATVNSGNVFTLNGRWQRIEQQSTTGNQFTINTYSSVTARDIEIFGAQIEEESYATSYIPTSGSTQTRASESCTGAGDVNTFNSVEGILYAEMKRDIATDNGFRRVNINDGSLNNTVRLGYSTVTDEIKGVVTVGGSTQCSLVFTGLSVTAFRKMALLYKANQFELWVDGSKRAEDTSGSTFSTGTLNDLSFQQSNGSDKLRAKVKDVRYYDTDGMSNTEITNLLTQLTQ